MVDWEYRVWDLNFEQDGSNGLDDRFIERNLNLPGSEGWELVAVIPYNNDGSRHTSGAIHYFKRAKRA